MSVSTEQETFWRSDFGDKYAGRNRGPRAIAGNLVFFSRVLDRTRGIRTVLELGANIGLNLVALRQLLPEVKISAVEINRRAASELKETLPEVDLHVTSILEFQPDRTWDLVFTKGVLIHINPDMLAAVYDLMYHRSCRYILLCEYYSPKPMEVLYRGHSDKLFKRDFAGELLEKFRDVSLVDYGFVYHGDPNFPQDDMNWFLMEK